MRARTGLRNGLLVVGTLALLGGCAGSGDTPAPNSSGGSSSSAGSPAAAPAGANGELYTTTYGGGEMTVRRYPLNADGSVGEPVTILTGPGDDTVFPAVIDSLGPTLLTGTLSDYWTTALQLRDLSGTETGSLPVDSWCGGEALVANLCTLLDATHLARTTELGGESTTEGSVIVSDLTDGSTVRQLGPFPGLSRMLGTTQPNVVLLATSTEKVDPDDPNVPGTVIRLDTSTGATSDVGDYPKDWNALCAVGDDGVIGQMMGTKPRLLAVGSASIGDVTLSPDDSPVGCSADGAFLYIQNVSQPPEGEEDDDAPNPSSALERVNLATGARDTVAAMPPGEWAGPTTR